jgi:hypothetical protein
MAQTLTQTQTPAQTQSRTQTQTRTQTLTIDDVRLGLNYCSVTEHCQALHGIRRLPFWWYQGTSRLFGNFSLPFQDAQGNWWYQVKPGFCWPVDFFTPLDVHEASPSLTRSYLGFQHIGKNKNIADTRLVINAITDLSVYGPNFIDSKRRNAIRKGLQKCELTVLRNLDEETTEGCRAAWNDLTQRTGWKHCADKKSFLSSWKLLLECPGVSIIVGRDRESGQVAGFLVTKIIGSTAYVDTIASRTELMRTNVNDAMMYSFVMSARELPGVTAAHFAIKSTFASLENFKTGMGFTPVPFPANTCLRGPMRVVMAKFFRDKYLRMIGRFDELVSTPHAGEPSLA